jgi:hypothetical protein
LCAVRLLTVLSLDYRSTPFFSPHNRIRTSSSPPPGENGIHYSLLLCERKVLQPHPSEAGDLPRSLAGLRNTKSRHCAWDRPRHSMLCVTIATSSTSGQDTQDPSRLAGTVRHAGPTLISQHHPPNQNLYSTAVASVSLTRRRIWPTTRSVRGGSPFCESNRQSNRKRCRYVARAVEERQG